MCITINFVDGSVLHFKEFIDVLNQSLEKLTYSYHYQNADQQLVFRYDNAAHKPPLSFIAHKHLPDQIVAAQEPTFAEILAEIFVLNRWMP